MNTAIISKIRHRINNTQHSDSYDTHNTHRINYVDNIYREKLCLMYSPENQHVQ